MIGSAEKSHAYHQPQPAASSKGSTISFVIEEHSSSIHPSLLETASGLKGIAVGILLQTVSEYVGLKGIAVGILVLVGFWKIFQLCKKGDLYDHQRSPYMVYIVICLLDRVEEAHH